MARVGVDCDGVLADFVQAFINIGRELWPNQVITHERWTDWNGGGQFTKRQEHEAWRRINGTPNFWLGVPAHEDSIRALAQWLATQTGQDLWIVTSRATTVGLSPAAQTQQWLDNCGVRPFYNYQGVITVPDSDDKGDICSRLDIRWMIDDKLETIQRFDEFPYFNAALLDRPWNRQAVVKWRVKSVAEFLAAVKG